MVFSSYFFICYFLPLVLGLYYISPVRIRPLVLTLASYLFYGWANPIFVLLMFWSTVVDYCCGLIIGREQEKRPSVESVTTAQPTRTARIALYVSVISNLSLLGFFKYFNFGIDSFIWLITNLGLDPLDWELFLRVTLPLGISFYTFQSMSYSIDIYRGHARAVKNFTVFACYVSMFPQLVAGPIVRFSEVEEQLIARTHTLEKFARGVSFVSLGLAKKILIANPCGKVADICFDAGSRDAIDAWYGLFAYSFQIYFDFSAYSDMAIGLGLFFGFVYPKNFDSPYKSRSITEFWQRWHLSLSHFLRDYLYVPLGGNRRGARRTYVNLAIVMLLGGLWHGASWNFVIWGGIHGSWLAFERTQSKKSIYRKLPAPIQVSLTFVIASLAWVFFRSSDFPSAWGYLLNLFAIGESVPGQVLIKHIIYQPYYLTMFGVAAIVTWTMPQTWDFTRTLTPIKALWCFCALYVSVIVMLTQEFNPFIYFIF